MEALIVKMAMIQTIADTIELLARLQPTAGEELHKRIDEIVMRLTNMAKSL